MPPQPPAVAEETPEGDLPRTGTRRGLVAVAVGLAAVAAVGVLGAVLGARDIAPLDVLRIVFDPDGSSYEHSVLWTERLPRTLLALLVGAALGASGLVMQALTANPLADPGILGIELGAAFAVVLGIVFLDLRGLTSYFWLALAGAAATAAVVYLIGTRSAAGGSALGLVLAGAAAAALLGSLITLVVIRDETVAAHLRFWSVGQLTGRASVLGEVAPFVVVGLVLALFLGRTLNVLGLGEDVATGLGLSVGRAQLGCAAVAVLLCAAATAGVGPVAFVGLVGGHVARMLVGTDHRWSLPLSMVCGAVLLTLADVASRLAPGSGEIPVGITTALIGTPFFVWLTRRRALVTL
jgi:iron complex transport system permease protein